MKKNNATPEEIEQNSPLDKHRNKIHNLVTENDIDLGNFGYVRRSKAIYAANNETLSQTSKKLINPQKE